VVCSFGIYFWWYRFWKNVFYGFLRKKELSNVDITVITALSGVINALMTNPIWFINTRMSVAKEKKGLIATVREIYENEGFKAFYKGVLPNMVLVLNPIINFVIYEALKKSAMRRNIRPSAAHLFLMSSFSKMMATIFTYPILTIKVKMQTASSKKDAIGPISFILRLLKDLGLKGLYIGVFAKLIQTVLYNAFMMVQYEKIRSLIKYLLLKWLKRRNRLPLPHNE